MRKSPTSAIHGSNNHQTTNLFSFSSKEEVCARFVKYDKDTSGRVTTDEAMTVLKEKFPNVNEDSLKCMIKRYDLDGSGNIHYNEFIYFYANIKYK